MYVCHPILICVMHINNWPAQERPREKLLARGAAALSDAELLALFLGSGLQGSNAVQTARCLLQNHGPLRQLLDCSTEELQKLPGIGMARACTLAAALEISRRHLESSLARGITMKDPRLAGRYFAQHLRHRPAEVFAAIFLDARHRLLRFEEMFHGTIDSAEVHPREIVRRALTLNATALIVGHNHPSGNPEPSFADRTVTNRLKYALALVDIRLLDHFVIGDGEPVSLAERGWL